jgi:hypothetical protein
MKTSGSAVAGAGRSQKKLSPIAGHEALAQLQRGDIDHPASDARGMSSITTAAFPLFVRRDLQPRVDCEAFLSSRIAKRLGMCSWLWEQMPTAAVNAPGNHICGFRRSRPGDPR